MLEGFITGLLHACLTFGLIAGAITLSVILIYCAGALWDWIERHL